MLQKNIKREGPYSLSLTPSHQRRGNLKLRFIQVISGTRNYKPFQKVNYHQIVLLSAAQHLIFSVG
jgi:hypothetical protein